MRKTGLATVIVTIAIALSGCSSTTTTSSPAVDKGASNEINGFGATLSAWKEHHIADKSGNFLLFSKRIRDFRGHKCDPKTDTAQPKC